MWRRPVRAVSRGPPQGGVLSLCDLSGSVVFELLVRPAFFFCVEASTKAEANHQSNPFFSPSHLLQSVTRLPRNMPSPIKGTSWHRMLEAADKPCRRQFGLIHTWPGCRRRVSAPTGVGVTLLLLLTQSITPSPPLIMAFWS